LRSYSSGKVTMPKRRWISGFTVVEIVSGVAAAMELVETETVISEEAELGREQVDGPELIGDTVKKTRAARARERKASVRVEGDEFLEKKGNDSIFVLV
jgi:hypothetical protein